MINIFQNKINNCFIKTIIIHIHFKTKITINQYFIAKKEVWQMSTLKLLIQ